MGNSHSRKSTYQPTHSDVDEVDVKSRSSRSLKHSRSVPGFRRPTVVNTNTRTLSQAQTDTFSDASWSSIGHPLSEKAAPSHIQQVQVPYPPHHHHHQHQQPPYPYQYQYQNQYPYQCQYQHHACGPPVPPGLHHATTAPPSSTHGQFYTHSNLTNSYIPPPTAGLILPAPSLPIPYPLDSATQHHSASENAAYACFLSNYPEYNLTWTLDALRRSEYARIDGGGGGGEIGGGKERETYVDYMGGALYPESLVNVHAEFLKSCVLGNTHSESNSSLLSSSLTSQARSSVLSFFNAPPGSTVIFTSNASTALKLVGESFPFTSGSSYVLPEDAHNSVHGIREFARRRGARVGYVRAGRRGGVREEGVKEVLLAHRPISTSSSEPSQPAQPAQPPPPSLLALTALSNISNSKLSPASLARLADYARELGYTTLLDAAALAPTGSLDLSVVKVDAVAISFYKMFGWPTGVGALILRPGVGEWLRKSRVWFAGGTVGVVQVPGVVRGWSGRVEESFEDGTINYLLLPSITTGLRFLSAYMPFLPIRMAALTHYLATELEGVTYPNSEFKACRVLSKVPGEETGKRPRKVGEVADAGSVISCLFYDSTGTQIPNSIISTLAATAHISLRTGCMCNPGGAAALLELQPLMARLHTIPGMLDADGTNERRDSDCTNNNTNACHNSTTSERPADHGAKPGSEPSKMEELLAEGGATLAKLEEEAGRELGVVRISLGLGSDWSDCWRILEWVRRDVLEVGTGSGLGRGRGGDESRGSWSEGSSRDSGIEVERRGKSDRGRKVTAKEVRREVKKARSMYVDSQGIWKETREIQQVGRAL
ncbi:PLP-dependent transferase [Stereum hirsutum FP-91666 SS1]|uniref:PLP-dependent transferase n=1 Tax=Stereum hirsutum (strain FP-91666) TaxID=721885 RepID=UPI000444A166|nr:PLP-dependent transferase [Stereum hirsutum FP-91666 SS1]EIM80857.1 PLP-dependent transferase [Stereum hirsutum FP-91666 SS1]